MPSKPADKKQIKLRETKPVTAFGGDVVGFDVRVILVDEDYVSLFESEPVDDSTHLSDWVTMPNKEVN